MSPDSFGRLAFIEIAGSPHDIGTGLGRFGRDAFHAHVVTTATWRELVERGRGDERMPVMLDLVGERFPRYLAELQGLSIGLELPFADVFSWNCRGDLWTMAPDGCTTVQFPGPPHVVGHNEDGSPGLLGHCALAHVRPTDGVAFTAFVYPGSIPGHTFAATGNGLVQTVNNIRPGAAGAGVPRMVLARAILDTARIDEALALLRDNPRAGAFHLTLAQAGDPRLVSVEFTSERLSVTELDRPTVHANHLVHRDARDVSQIITGSSAARQRRGTALLPAAEPGEAAALRILRDMGDPELPIWRRDPADLDHENTLATAIFRIEADKVRWSVYDGRDRPARFEMTDGLTPIPA